MSDKKATFIIVDDHAGYILGLRMIIEDLSQTIEIIGEALTIEDGWRLYHELKPDGMIVDMQFRSQTTGLILVNQLLNQPEPVRIVVLSSAGDSYRQMVSTLGVQLCLDKSSLPKDMVHELDQLGAEILSKKTTLLTRFQAKRDTNTEDYAKPEEQQHLKQLSDKELELLKLFLFDERPLKSSVNDLKISIGTARQRLHLIYLKLGVRNQKEARALLQRTQGTLYSF